ncbi:MAG: HD domain-containing phosphohydrolase [Carboxydocellales bacterium]
MKRKVLVIRHIFLPGIYGGLIGAVVPIFATFIYQIAAGQAPNLAKLWEVQTQNLSIMLLDLVPVLYGIVAVKLSIELQKFNAKLQKDRRARTELSEQLDRWKAIFDHNPVGYAVMDRELNIVYANKIYGELAGANNDQLLGQKCFDYFGSGEVCKECPVARAFVSKVNQSSTKKELNHQGEVNTLKQIAVPIVKNGQVKQVIEIVIDITEQVRLLQDRHQELVATIDTVVGIIDLKDGYTGGHSQRVRRWAVRIARSLGLTEQQVIDIDIAASLHDVGKIGIAGLILNKPGDLTKTEYETIKKHPVLGSESLASVPRLEQVTKIIRHHHESYGGNGYPDGLSGLEIPIGSRVICAADAFDAMTSDRVYRKAMSKEKAMEQLELGAGKQFDPRVVEAFLELIGEPKVIKFPLAWEKLS